MIREAEGEVNKVENQGVHDFAYPQSKEMKAGTFCNSRYRAILKCPSG